MRSIKFVLLAGLLLLWYQGQGQDVVKSEKSVAPAIAKADYKALLEKFAQAYSTLDDKALSALADKPETITATLKELDEFKKAGVSPVLTIIPLQQRSEQELTAIDALVSLSVKDKYFYRNGPALYIFKGDKLTGVRKNFNPAFISSFWHAVLLADEVGVIESADRAKELKITSLLPDKKFEGKLEFPPWIIYQVRTPGKYLIPLKKDTEGYSIAGQHYPVPALSNAAPEKLVEIFKHYQTLKPEAEKAFLKELLQDETMTALALPCVSSLVAMGEFRNPLAPQELKYWQDVYSRKDMPKAFKRHLLLALSGSNFLESKALFTDALQDPELNPVVSFTCYRKDKKAFEALMLKWLDDPKLRQYALQNSELLAGNSKYAAAAMKFFDPKAKDTGNLKYFLPVLCASDNNQGDKLIKTFLTETANPDDLVFNQKMFESICRYKPTAYTDEIKIFLNNHKKNELLLKSTVYPMALYCLCKSNDPVGYKSALEYIAKIEADLKEKKDTNSKMLFMTVFFQYAPRYRNLDQFKQDFQGKLAVLEKAQATVPKNETKK